MPFGLRNAGATQQRLVDTVLHGLLWESMAVYIDDAVVYTRGSFDDHVRHLRQFYTRMRKAGLHVKPTKCKLARSEVELLGHVVDGLTRSPTAGNIRAVVDYKRPRTAPQLRSFLGMSSYFRAYVEHFADEAAPLYDLLNSKKRVAQAWHVGHEEAFLSIKRRLTEAPLLYLPIYGTGAGQFEVQVDASKRGIGAVLLQHKRGAPEDA